MPLELESIITSSHNSSIPVLHYATCITIVLHRDHYQHWYNFLDILEKLHLNSFIHTRLTYKNGSRQTAKTQSIHCQKSMFIELINQLSHCGCTDTPYYEMVVKWLKIAFMRKLKITHFISFLKYFNSLLFFSDPCSY